MTPSPANVNREFPYGLTWLEYDSIAVELEAIRRGGIFKLRGEVCGCGLPYHYERFQSLLWPWKEWHKWNRLLLQSFAKNRIVGIMGPASSGKTHEAACLALSEYFAFPHETTTLVSSTDVRSLELRIWGEIKKLYSDAKKNWPQCPGKMIESRQMLVTDDAPDHFDEDENAVTDFRNGIVGVPCMTGGTFVGLGKYVGIKNKRLRLYGDELSLMSRAFFDAISNLNKNRGFKMVGMGNPQDPMDPLGLLCEPHPDLGGWNMIQQSLETTTWPTRMPQGICVQFVGTDSPNYEVEDGEDEPYPFLIGRRQIEDDEKYYGRDSLQFQMMDLGIMPKGTQLRRVITKMICDQHHAMEEPVWAGEAITQLIGIDAAYSSVGGDRTALIHLGFGAGKNGRQIAALMVPPIVVPVTDPKRSPEDQVVEWVRAYAEQHKIPPERTFFDSTGRGTLMSAFGRIWSPLVVPVEFGGQPTERTVSNIINKPAKEHFSKFVSELWFAVRYLVEAEQLYGMTPDVVTEGCMREWKIVAGFKVEVEPKDITKKRMGRSPDLFDALAVAVEGARRLGLGIYNVPRDDADMRFYDYARDLRSRKRDLDSSKRLQFAGFSS